MAFSPSFHFSLSPLTSGPETSGDGALSTSQFITKLGGTEVAIPLTTEVVNALPHEKPWELWQHLLQDHPLPSHCRLDLPLHTYMCAHTCTHKHTRLAVHAVKTWYFFFVEERPKFFCEAPGIDGGGVSIGKFSFTVGQSLAK